MHLCRDSAVTNAVDLTDDVPDAAAEREPRPTS